MLFTFFQNDDLRNKMIDLIMTNNLLTTAFEGMMYVPPSIFLLTVCYYFAKREPLNRLVPYIEEFLLPTVEDFGDLPHARIH
jgi:hypothetical protein